MGKYEVTWDEYELWMINLDKDNREYNNKESDKSDTLSDAVTKPTAPYVDMSFGMGKSGHPAICMTQLSAKMYCMWLSARTGRFIAFLLRQSGNMPVRLAHYRLQFW